MNDGVTSDVVIGTLTAVCIKALKQADSVSFHRTRGKGVINGCKRVKDSGPYEDRERNYKIQCVAAVSLCDEDMGYEERDAYCARAECFEMIFSSKYSPEWKTVCKFLKKGDVIGLHWSADGMRNGYVKEARVTERSEATKDAGYGMELHVDALYLRIKRGKEEFSFLISVQVGPDNTARMIRG